MAEAYRKRDSGKVTSIQAGSLEKLLQYTRKLGHKQELSTSQFASLLLTGSFPKEYGYGEQRMPLEQWVAQHIAGHEKAHGRVHYRLLNRYGWKRTDLDKLIARYREAPLNVVSWEGSYSDGKKVRKGAPRRRQNPQQQDKVKDHMVQYLSEIGQYKLLTPEEEYSLARRVRNGDTKARKKFIQSNLRLAVSIAKRYMRDRLEPMDVLSMANEGLIKAVDRFDPDFGCKFSTYASWWIKQVIKRGIPYYLNTVYKPPYLRQRLRRFRRFNDEFFKLHGRKADKEDYLDAGFNPNWLKYLMGLVNSTVLGLHDKDGSYYKPSEISTSDEHPVFDGVPTSILTDDVVHLSHNSLTWRERFILSRRFPDNGPKETLDQIGKRLKLCRERIRQIEADALRKLDR